MGSSARNLGTNAPVWAALRDQNSYAQTRVCRTSIKHGPNKAKDLGGGPLARASHHPAGRRRRGGLLDVAGLDLDRLGRLDVGHFHAGRLRISFTPQRAFLCRGSGRHHQCGNDERHPRHFCEDLIGARVVPIVSGALLYLAVWYGMVWYGISVYRRSLTVRFFFAFTKEDYY